MFSHSTLKYMLLAPDYHWKQEFQFQWFVYEVWASKTNQTHTQYYSMRMMISLYWISHISLFICDLFFKHGRKSFGNLANTYISRFKCISSDSKAPWQHLLNKKTLSVVHYIIHPHTVNCLLSLMSEEYKSEIILVWEKMLFRTILWKSLYV